MITATDLTKTYGETTALAAVSVAWDEGLHCLAGPNGSGKTTLLRVLAGLTRHDSGSVTVPESLGVAFQTPNVYVDLTVAENLDVFGALAGATDEWRASLVDQLRLDPVAGRTAGALSGGFQKKLDLALALLKRPDALLLDEPLADLDPATRRRLVDTVTRYSAEHTVVASTHHLDAFADDYATLTVVRDGRLLDSWDRPAAPNDPGSVYNRLLDRENGF
ncbi:ABC transporter ATP-binding protein [Halobacterium sp. BOL4-2]|uniref:ATP-binding cassette domain-containing protein n=1 Tax=Halobacterium sp. BOL4-2 TaxID=2810537 RepID=UPI0019651747|nr:ABC transporter ATP-binding protein [Halobacterium sp. BOL4-2]QRY25739.1 ABC transporter ATP-binding protein [Halobacterium sp. BOL4-2]